MSTKFSERIERGVLKKKEIYFSLPFCRDFGYKLLKFYTAMEIFFFIFDFSIFYQEKYSYEIWWRYIDRLHLFKKKQYFLFLHTPYVMRK